MINLIPPKEKAQILSEEKRKMAIILWSLVLLFLVCFILILGFLKFYISGEEGSQRIILERLEADFKQSEIQDIQERISFINIALTKLDTFYDGKIYLTETLEKVSSSLPEDIYLNSLSIISIDTEEEHGLKISLSGLAPTRDNLFALKESLEKEGSFKEVYFPPANWVEPSDIDFFATFKIDISK